MTRVPMTKTPARGSDLESYIEAFEESPQARGPKAIAAFLPRDDHPMFTSISAELVRVDLERRYARDDRAELEEYRSIAPDLFEATEVLAEVAFEEYRLRCRTGEQPDPKEYERSYGIDSKTWPELHLPAVQSNEQNSPDSGQSVPGVGDMFGCFELREELGRGAFGIVYLARQHELASRDVVLKITPCRSLEAQRLAKLQHTNITPIYSTHSDGEWVGICMPFLGRTTLADRLAGDKLQRDLSTVVDRVDKTVQKTVRTDPVTNLLSHGKEDEKRTVALSPLLSEREAASIVLQLAEGLAHAHQRGIVHSDLKPANILLGEDGVARLLDFNLAADSTAEEPQTLLVGGTLPYLSPEHLESLDSGSPILPTSDIYSLGVLLFELLTGRLPFRRPTGCSPKQIAELTAERRAFKASDIKIFPKLSPALRGIVAKALAPATTDRYASAEDLAKDLRRHLANQTLLHADEPIGPERFSKWRRLHARALRWSAASLMLAAVALLSWGLVGRSERLSQSEAQVALGVFRQNATTAMLHLHTPGPEPEVWAMGAQAARNALDQFAPAQGNERRLAMLGAEERDWVHDQSNRLRRFLGEHQRRIDPTTSTTSPLGLDTDPLADNPLALAIAMTNVGDYNGVVALLSRPVESSSSDPAGWLLLGNAQVARGQLVDAEASYTALIALQPQAMVGPYYRGLVRFQAGRYSLAEQDFTDALATSPGKSCLLLNRALVRRRLGKLRLADEDVSLALTQDDTNPRAWFLRADIRRELGDQAKATLDTKAGLACEPMDDLGWSARGLALLEQSEERGLAELQKGLALFPQSSSLLKNIVHVLADRMDRSEEAVGYVNTMVAAHPEDESARLTRAILSARQGDRQAAMKDIKGIDPHQTPPLVALQLSCVYAITSSNEPSDAQQAISHLQIALRAEPRLSLRAGRDPDLQSLRQLPEYRQLMTAAARLAAPISLPKTAPPIANTL